MQNLLKYLKDNFPDCEPIFIKELELPFMPKSTLRVRVKELCDTGILKRRCTGVYYLADQDDSSSLRTPPSEEIINRRFIEKNGRRIGYRSFNAFTDEKRESNVVYVVSNAARSEHRTVNIDNIVIDIKKPRCEIDEDNFRILQFLDMICELKTDEISDLVNTRKNVRAYLKTMGLESMDLAPFVKYYPDRIFKTLYELELLNFRNL